MSGPSARVAGVVDRRDDFACTRCGRSLFTMTGSRHHRQLRRGGLHDASNLILLCGSGTTGCHGWVHRHPEKALADGWMVRVNGLALPSEVPLHYHRAEWVLLGSGGGIRRITPGEATELLVMLGQRKVASL